MHRPRAPRLSPRFTPVAALGLAAAVLLGACGTATDTDPLDGVAATFHEELTIPPGEVEAIVAFLNAPATTRSVLDDYVGLNGVAVDLILEHRNGVDGRYLTDDDDLFDDLEELDAVEFVGTLALERIRAWLQENPLVQAEIVEGIEFSPAQAEAVVWGVNRTDAAYLETAVGLDERAATSLVLRGPYRTVTEMGPAYWVGPVALSTLRDHAPIWTATRALEEATHQAGTYDDVTFDEQTARVALEIANTASTDELVAGGLGARNANRVVTARPYRSMTEVSLTWGIGRATVQALHDFATSGEWTSAED